MEKTLEKVVKEVEDKQREYDRLLKLESFDVHLAAKNHKVEL